MVLVGLYFWLAFPLDWETISYRKSPDGEMVAYHLKSNSEAGDAPYGDHIILAEITGRLGNITGKQFSQHIVMMDPNTVG